MAVMDEFKEQREALKNGTFKEKASYFWYYYKWHVIVTIIAIIAISSIIHQAVTHKDEAFFAVMLNATELEGAEAYNQSFLDYAGIDTDAYDAYFDTSIRITDDTGMLDETTITSSEKLMVYTAAAQIDVMVTDSASMQKYANSSTFYDLRDILSPEQLEKYTPYFYYVDRKTVEELEKAQDNMDDSYVAVFTDPTKPEDMEEPVPVAIFVDSSQALHDNYYFRGDDLVLGVYCNTKHLDASLSYIDFLLSSQE